MVHLLITILITITFNLVNSQLDAVRILGNKNVSHALNLGTYLVACGIAWWIFEQNYHWDHILVYTIMIFSCRQITFDIPLNWRRGLNWDYVSPANPPKAIMDRIEQWIFGKNGRLPVYIYSGIWFLSTAEMIWTLYK